MKIYDITQIGEFHINHNEDAFCIAEIDEQTIALAIMDGCSMGTESHFASTLTAKIIRKICKELSYKAFAEKSVASVKEYAEEIFRRLFTEIKQIKNILHLEREEVLNTLILVVYNKIA